MFEAVQFIERKSATEPETPLGDFEIESDAVEEFVLDLRSGELMEVPTA